MDERTIREQLEMIGQKLQQLDAEREVLSSLVRGYETLLRIRELANKATPQSIVQKQRPRSARIKGTISLRSAVLRVIRDALGEPLHSKEIWRRAQDLGAITSAKSPEGIVDFMAYSLKNQGEPLEKVAPRTWRWCEPDGGNDSGESSASIPLAAVSFSAGVPE